MSIASETSFSLSCSTMWFIIRGKGLVLDFLFLFRLPNGVAVRLCSEFLSAKTNLTGLLSVRPISATVSHNGTCVESSSRRLSRRREASVTESKRQTIQFTADTAVCSSNFRVGNDGGGGDGRSFTLHGLGVETEI